jgi:hypothetical protein
MTLEQSTIQDHFAFGKMRSMYMVGPREDDEDRIYQVKGLKATKNEYNVAKALDAMELDYQFQMTTGKRGQSFTVILDFLVQTVPQPTPLWVHGEHWHMGDRRAKDIRQQTIVDDFLGGAAANPVEIWGDQSDTYERALLYVRKALR